MKIYVDELPKSCLDCEFCNKKNYCCWLMQKDVRDYRDNCPLQSLIEHDKQVRKEVVQEIGEQLGLIIVTDGSMTGDKTIMTVLDQIQEQ